jgi:hypothetical protein
MAYKTRVKPHVRRRPVKKDMQELLDRLGVKPTIYVGAHDRRFTARRPKPEDREEKEEREDGEER